MKIALIVLLGIAAAYLVLILAPAAVFFLVIFSKRKRGGVAVLDTVHPYYAPFADRLKDAADYLQALPSRTLRMKAPDGVRLCGRFYDAGGSDTVVFLHGYNSPMLSTYGAQAADLRRQGYNLCFLYQRAHGGSEGTTTMGLREAEDLLAWIPWLQKQTPTRRVLLYGVSMGSATVAYASDRLDPAIVRGMVLDCGYASPDEQFQQEMRRRHLPAALIRPWLIWFARWFCRVDITRPAADALGKTAVAALFFHGEADVTVPVEQGRRNFDACASPKEWCSIPGAAHTVCYLTGDEITRQRLRDFARRCFEERKLEV
ncbi:MAG: alpha/beta hydrolase [Acutalibacteraceae bacterium]|jgi:pimeloyl-ACP methyl ester carboxylesterase